MLDQLRQGAQGWVSKLLMAVLVLSFAIWGIGGFNGYHADQLARVGNTTVSMQEFGRLYDQAQRNSQRSGQQVNPWSRHACVTRSNSTRSRRINPMAAPKMTIVPTRLPKIGSLFSQNGNATSPPHSGGTVSASAIQNQLNSFKGRPAHTTATFTQWIGGSESNRHSHSSPPSRPIQSCPVVVPK